MATQGPFYPGTVTTESAAPESANDWLTPSNIGADDGSEAQITAATFDSPDISFRLKASNFGFTIPAGSTIDGITVAIDRRSIVASSGKDNRVQLLDAAGALIGDNKADAVTVWPTTTAIATYGGAADKWGWTGVTLADINDPDFGVVLSALANIANADIGVDFIRVTVNYTAPPSLTSATMEDADRSFAEDRTDLTLNFDRGMELGGANYTVGDPVLGLTIEINGGVASAVTYQSGEGAATWKVRHPAYLSIADVVTITYDPAAAGSNLVAVTGGVELFATTDQAVTNNLTKRIILILKRADNSAITTEVAVGVFDGDPRDVDDASWMALQQKLRATPDGTGRLNFQYTGAQAPGTNVYVAVFHPVEDSSAASAATQAMVWPSLIE